MGLELLYFYFSIHYGLKEVMYFWANRYRIS